MTPSLSTELFVSPSPARRVFSGVGSLRTGQSRRGERWWLLRTMRIGARLRPKPTNNYPHHPDGILLLLWAPYCMVRLISPLKGFSRFGEVGGRASGVSGVPQGSVWVPFQRRKRQIASLIFLTRV